MILKPLIDKTQRAKIGWDQPTVRVYPLRKGANVIFNKSACRLMNIGIKEKFVISQDVDNNELYLSICKDETYGYSGYFSEKGACRFFISENEYIKLLSYFKYSEKSKILFHPHPDYVVFANDELFKRAYRLHIQHL